MTAPRQVLPGTAVMITRRCVDRRFLLHGSPMMNQIFAYLLALACQEFEFELWAAVAMSDHHHLDGLDLSGRHPELTAWLHAQLARATNCLRGRSGQVWEAGAPSVVELADAEAVIESCAYVLANPTQAGLVAHGHEWTGFRSEPDAAARGPRRIKRPVLSYFEGDRWPEEVELRFGVPPGESPEEFGERLRRRVAAKELEARRAVRGKGREFKGPDRLRRQSWRDRAASLEGRGRVLRPLVKGAKAARDAVLRRIAVFRVGYREALKAFVAGSRGVVFPFGTYAMVVRLGVERHPPP